MQSSISKKQNLKILHVGCGSDPLPEWLSVYNETRLDINEAVSPNIVASMFNMGDIGKYDVVLCQHALEHVYEHEVGLALREFLRVLNDGGHALIFVPDLEGVMPTSDILLESPAGPITGRDMIYGYGKAIAGNPHMAHKTGFIKSTMEEVMSEAGFSKFKAERLGNYNLMGVGVK